MHVDRMRRIDKCAGVPLCWLLTLFFRFKEKIRRPRTKDVSRVLFIELSEMGSTILADPAMRKVKGELKADLFFLIFAKNRESLDFLATVAGRNVRTIRENNFLTLLWDSCTFLIWARRKRIDTVIDLELFSRFTALLSALSGATRRVGFYRFHLEGLYRGELLTHRVAYNPHQHIAKNFIALVNSLTAPAEELPYSKTRIGDEEIRLQRVRYPQGRLDAMRDTVRRYAPDYDDGKNRLVLINPNASELLPQRRWMMERYEELIRRVLSGNKELLVLVTGSPGEREEAGRLCQRISDPRCVNFAGAVALGDLPVLYSLAALMVSNDSGPGHFSSITAMPVIVLFGPETPALYGPLGHGRALYAGLACSPCVSAANHRKTPCRDNRCLQAITVDQVYAAVSEVLRAATGSVSVQLEKSGQNGADQVDKDS